MLMLACISVAEAIPKNPCQPRSHFLVICVIRGDVHGKLGWAGAVTLLVLASTAGVAWTARWSWKYPIAAVIFVGAASALFVNVFSVVPDDKPARPPVATK